MKRDAGVANHNNEQTLVVYLGLISLRAGLVLDYLLPAIGQYYVILPSGQITVPLLRMTKFSTCLRVVHVITKLVFSGFLKNNKIQ